MVSPIPDSYPEGDIVWWPLFYWEWEVTEGGVWHAPSKWPSEPVFGGETPPRWFVGTRQLEGPFLGYTQR